MVLAVVVMVTNDAMGKLAAMMTRTLEGGDCGGGSGEVCYDRSSWTTVRYCSLLCV